MVRQSGPSPKDVAKVQRWEQKSLSDYFARMAAVGSDPELEALWQAVRALVFAQSPREVMNVITANPRLLTARADAVLDSTELFVNMVSMPSAPAMLRDRREWLSRMREVGTGGSGPALPDA
jgi:hypothetical protein